MTFSENRKSDYFQNLNDKKLKIYGFSYFHVTVEMSSHRRDGLAPRCPLITSRGWRRSQGFGCSLIKVLRELGLPDFYKRVVRQFGPYLSWAQDI